MRVGMIGLGVMGRGMARNVLKAGFALTVWNRSTPAVEELVPAGATPGRGPAGVAADAEVILLCLPDTRDVEGVLFGEGGVAAGIRPGSVVVDTSTISAAATRDFAARLEALGAALVDSPVSGGEAGARDGTLACMIGGSEAAVDKAMPVLRAIGAKHVHLGGPGAGQVVKSCNQLVIGATVMAVGEAIALCRNAGIDPYAMRDALLAGSAASKVLEAHGKRLLDDTLTPGFRSALMRKDIMLALEAGRDFGVFMPGTALVAQLFTASCNAGHAGLDSAALGKLLAALSEDQSGGVPPSAL